MNSLQKETSEAYVAAFEKNLSMLDKTDDIEILMKKLKFLGLNFDPFGPDISSECLQIMDSLGLTHHLSNPYAATNILLKLLDKTEERLNNLKQ
ncbi:MAG TPA: hypothetical protein VNJ08_07445 [Bacteriovoracaceae bacterium]|nr:hypothetical protein [Bacteriovoracaceae bacterium]